MWAHFSERRKFYVKNCSILKPFFLVNLHLEKTQIYSDWRWVLLRIFPGSQDLTLPTAMAAAASVSYKGREIWGCGMTGVPSSIRLPFAPGGFHWLRKSSTEKKAQSLQVYLFLPLWAHFHIKELSFSIFNRAEAILEFQRIYHSLNLDQLCLLTLSKPRHPLFPPSFLFKYPLSSEYPK